MKKRQKKQKKTKSKSHSHKAAKSVATKTELKAIILVVFCTLLTSLGQILFKYGTQKGIGSFMQIVTNIPLISGFVFYGLASILLIIALKNGHLSVLYPFIALSFVWVTISSIILFKEHVFLLNWLGIAAIILGVSFMGIGSSK